MCCFPSLVKLRWELHFHLMRTQDLLWSVWFHRGQSEQEMGTMMSQKKKKKKLDSGAAHDQQLQLPWEINHTFPQRTLMRGSGWTISLTLSHFVTQDSECWRRSVLKFAEITSALVRERSFALVGQLLQVWREGAAAAAETKWILLLLWGCDGNPSIHLMRVG